MNSDASNKIGSTSFIDTLNKPSKATEPKKRDQSQIGKDEFLQLLITQLKNQDPMDPMKNDQFAVDMAQFAQVEQLVSINDKLEKSAGTDLGSLATYLGREVSLTDEAIEVKGGNGGRIKVNVAGDAAAVKLQLLAADGSLVNEFDLGAMSAGSQSFSLNDLGTRDGAYQFKVVATTDQGRPVDARAAVSGVVSGFVPGPDPKLLIGSREISPSDIREVGLASGI